MMSGRKKKRELEKPCCGTMHFEFQKVVVALCNSIFKKLSFTCGFFARKSGLMSKTALVESEESYSDYRARD